MVWSWDTGNKHPKQFLLISFPLNILFNFTQSKKKHTIFFINRKHFQGKFRVTFRIKLQDKLCSQWRPDATSKEHFLPSLLSSSAVGFISEIILRQGFVTTTRMTSEVRFCLGQVSRKRGVRSKDLCILYLLCTWYGVLKRANIDSVFGTFSSPKERFFVENKDGHGFGPREIIPGRREKCGNLALSCVHIRSKRKISYFTVAFLYWKAINSFLLCWKRWKVVPGRMWQIKRPCWLQHMQELEASSRRPLPQAFGWVQHSVGPGGLHGPPRAKSPCPNHWSFSHFVLSQRGLWHTCHSCSEGGSVWTTLMTEGWPCSEFHVWGVCLSSFWPEERFFFKNYRISKWDPFRTRAKNHQKISPQRVHSSRKKRVYFLFVLWTCIFALDGPWPKKCVSTLTCWQSKPQRRLQVLSIYPWEIYPYTCDDYDFVLEQNFVHVV